MRYAVISDVHGNLQALQAVVTAARSLAVDHWVCAGDVVGYGARPSECVALVDELSATWVAGNHELLVGGVLTTARCTRMAASSVRWTQDVLSQDVLARLADLPLQAELPGLTIAHGSPGDPEEYVRSGDRADVLLQGRSDGLVLGHTHAPWLRVPGRDVLRGGTGVHHVGPPFLLNPGSVGQSRDVSPDARFAIVDMATKDVELLAVPYDVREARTDLVRAGLPPISYHVRPTWRRRAAGRAPGLARRVQAWRR